MYQKGLNIDSKGLKIVYFCLKKPLFITIIKQVEHTASEEIAGV